MINKKCIICNNEFETYNNKYCSRECYFLAKKPKRTESHKLKNKLSLLEYYKTEDWQIKKKERGKKISESNKIYLTEKQIEVLTSFLKQGYVYNLHTLAKHIKCGSYKNIINEFNKNEELKKLYEKSLKFLPEKIQKLSLLEWENFKNNFSLQNGTEFCQNFKINEKTHLRIKKHFELCSRKYARKVETKPEKIFKNILIELNIPFTEQVSLNKKYIIDFVIGNIAVEIQGDYWHGNPRFYSEENYTSQQVKNISRDFLKHKAILESEMLLIELWEYDIYKKINKVKKLLNIIKNGRFNRKFYNSGTWS